MKSATIALNEIKALNYKQLASMYDVTHKTLKSWLLPFNDEIGEQRGKTFTIKQVRIIFEKLGEPGNALI